ncbi:MAG: Uma2 family endonuclease [Lewinellaceae bacterium]|nr:Uma2 family endonuclease [Lewinellaceae bacterium]
MFLPRRLVQNNIFSFSAHQHFSDRLLGSPDMVVEILSEGNNKADADEKFNIYQDAGILEYWIALPDTPLPDTLTH